MDFSEPSELKAIILTVQDLTNGDRSNLKSLFSSSPPSLVDDPDDFDERATRGIDEGQKNEDLSTQTKSGEQQQKEQPNSQSQQKACTLVFVKEKTIAPIQTKRSALTGEIFEQVNELRL
eukprot:c15994_g1_i1.p2 GENE.c15994_g1_i1~~c15994_g1_i1.p2  ORF type:complete len:120 (-),score=56.66 c15994_g1_i1:509-868(-)